MPIIRAVIVPHRIADVGVFAMNKKLTQIVASLSLSIILLPATTSPTVGAEEASARPVVVRGEDREASKSVEIDTKVAPAAWADGGRGGPVIARGEEREAIKSLDITERPDRLGHFYGNTVRRRSERAMEPARRSAYRAR
jgi:hypothetical protein